MRQVQLLFRVIIGGVLVYAGFLKAVGPSAEFAAIIAAYKILPAAMISPFSIGLPYVEMWIGMFLLFGLYTRQASLATIVLVGSFSLALISSFLRGIDLVSCGCFGAETLSPKYTIILDFVMLTMSVTCFRQSKTLPAYSLDRVIP